MKEHKDEISKERETLNQAYGVLQEKRAERTADVGRRAQIREQQVDVDKEIVDVEAENYELVANRQFGKGEFTRAAARMAALRNESQLLMIGLRHFDIYKGADGERDCLAATLAVCRATLAAENARKVAHSETVLSRLASVVDVSGPIQLADGIGDIAAAHEELVHKADLAVQAALKELENHDRATKTARHEFHTEKGGK